LGLGGGRGDASNAPTDGYCTPCYPHCGLSTARFLECLGSDRAEQLIAVTAEFLVDSIDGLTSSNHIGKGFVGLILLPILGSAASMLSPTLPIFPH
jgi:hypothetical protein